MVDPVTATVAVGAIISTSTVLVKAAKDILKEVQDVGSTSLPGYGKMLRITSRVYIDASVASDPVTTDVLKTVHTQYAAFILAGLQMNQMVTDDKNVQDLLKVVASEDARPHESVLEGLFGNATKIAGETAKQVSSKTVKKGSVIDNVTKTVQNAKDQLTVNGPPRPGMDDPKKTGKEFVGGEIKESSHLPTGKVIEITLTNPKNPKANVTMNLLVQLAPYIVPEPIAVQFIIKDVLPSYSQRWLQWTTGEISFWKDFVWMSDIVNNRAKLLKLDPSGVLADMMGKQASSQVRVLKNLNEEKALRARNIANSVLVFNSETVRRAKAQVAIDLNDYAMREKYFATTFAMMIVIVDPLYNQVTFYYNGLPDSATFSFDQMKTVSKGNGSLDLISVMAALSQGKSPKF